MFGVFSQQFEQVYPEGLQHSSWFLHGVGERFDLHHLQAHAGPLATHARHYEPDLSFCLLLGILKKYETQIVHHRMIIVWYLNYCNALMQKYSNAFLRRWADDLRNRQTEAINTFRLCWKLLKINFRQLFLKRGNTFDYFWVTLSFVFKLLLYHKEYWNFVQQKQNICTG